MKIHLQRCERRKRDFPGKSVPSFFVDSIFHKVVYFLTLSTLCSCNLYRRSLFTFKCSFQKLQNAFSHRKLGVVFNAPRKQLCLANRYNWIRPLKFLHLHAHGKRLEPARSPEWNVHIAAGTMAAKGYTIHTLVLPNGPLNIVVVIAIAELIVSAAKLRGLRTLRIS